MRWHDCVHHRGILGQAALDKKATDRPRVIVAVVAATNSPQPLKSIFDSEGGVLHWIWFYRANLVTYRLPRPEKALVNRLAAFTSLREHSNRWRILCFLCSLLHNGCCCPQRAERIGRVLLDSYRNRSYSLWQLIANHSVISVETMPTR